ncbi:MAG: outer membrane lipoprotein-sorting protein [Candidatus Aminicenantes bacterium]|nr:MAG: outer membrane lipoprotein-sorting protein [Candidatus Aminicenantes bacterium]
MRKAAHRCGCVVVLFLFFFVMTVPVDPAPTKADAKEIVKKMDELYRSESSFAVMEMEIITPHWKRTLKMEAWSIGMDKTFIRILLPKKERGIATLRIENEMWNFLPKTNKVMKIPPSMMMASWMGSDFTNDDLVKEYTFLDDYSFDFTEVENPREGVVYVKCVPREGLPIVWGHIITAVREKDYIPLWAKYYDEKGQLMREIQYKDTKTLGKRRIPAVMELVPTHKEGHKTIVRYLEAQFDINVDKGIFTLRNLRSRI